MNKEILTPNVTPHLTTNRGESTLSGKSLYAHYFFVAMASLFIIISAVGFGQSLQVIQAQKITIFWFVHVHGAFMAMWLLVFLTQAILAISGNLKIHRQLGQFTVVLGILVFVFTGIVIFHAHVGYPIRTNISWSNVLFLVLTTSLFGLFLTWGIIKRKNAAAHKRLLLLATLVLISAGFNRLLLFAGVDPTILWLDNPSLHGMPNPSALLFYNDLLLIPLFIYDLVTLRSIHKWTLIASGCIIAVQIIILSFWGVLT
jgi:uncharacterized membrane protein YozB (DUF420 family)